jgi:F-type H+-transporting ATPase subunit b
MHIDGWTLLLQTVNFLVLMALLRWLFYHPLIAVIDGRRKALDAQFAQARAAEEAATARARSLEETRAAVEAGRSGVLRDAQAAAAQETAAARDKAAREAAAALEEAKRRIEREKQEAARVLLEQASRLAGSLATGWLARFQEGDAASLYALDEHLARIPAAEREGWFSGNQRTLEVATAHRLDEAATAQLATRLAARFAPPPRIHFTVDPSLVAGAELRFPLGRLALHWSEEVAAAQERIEGQARTGPLPGCDAQTCAQAPPGATS